MDVEAMEILGELLAMIPRMLGYKTDEIDLCTDSEHTHGKQVSGRAIAPLNKVNHKTKGCDPYFNLIDGRDGTLSGDCDKLSSVVYTMFRGLMAILLKNKGGKSKVLGDESPLGSLMWVTEYVLIFANVTIRKSMAVAPDIESDHEDEEEQEQKSLDEYKRTGHYSLLNPELEENKDSRLICHATIIQMPLAVVLYLQAKGSAVMSSAPLLQPPTCKMLSGVVESTEYSHVVQQGAAVIRHGEMKSARSQFYRLLQRTYKYWTVCKIQWSRQDTEHKNSEYVHAVAGSCLETCKGVIGSDAPLVASFWMYDTKKKRCGIPFADLFSPNICSAESNVAFLPMPTSRPRSVRGSEPYLSAQDVNDIQNTLLDTEPWTRFVELDDDKDVRTELDSEKETSKFNELRHQGKAFSMSLLLEHWMIYKDSLLKWFATPEVSKNYRIMQEPRQQLVCKNINAMVIYIRA